MRFGGPRSLWPLAFAVLAASSLVSGCATHPRGRPAPRDTLWYVSTRARTDAGRDLRAVAPTLEYGAAIFERTSVRDPGSDVLSFTLRDSLRLTRTAFLDALQARVGMQPAPDDFAVLYVHGFGTGLDECWSHPIHARGRSVSSAPWVAFCWPSHGAGITWPRLGSVFVRAYEQDTAAMTASAPAFRSALHDLITALGARHVLLAAHSLGGRLVSEELARSVRASSPRDSLRALVFLAPDHESLRFADTLVPALRGTARRLVLYTERRDRVLTISRRMHDAPRAGLADPSPLVRDGLETVDVTNALATDSWLQRLIGNRHSIRRASGLLWDLTHLVGAERSAACRDALGTGRLDLSGVWQLQPVAPPDPARLARCQAYTPPAAAPPPTAP